MRTPAVPHSLGPEADIPALHHVYRSYIEHENGLIYQRITSGLAIHGFLFTFYGVALAKLTGDADAGRHVHTAGVTHSALALARYGTLTIGVAGIVAALITMASVGAAVVTIGRLSDQWNTAAQPRADQLGLPRMSGAGSDVAMALGFGSTLALPFLIVCCWIAVLATTGGFALFG